jgi:hypothetical protein
MCDVPGKPAYQAEIDLSERTVGILDEKPEN